MIYKKNSLVNIAAYLMLTLMGVLMFSSIADDSIIIDEDPHIGAGYGYLKKGDFRMNPEHPPLLKDLGALPLLWMDINEPWDDESWVSATSDPNDHINDQWNFGRMLIFGNGNNGDAITQAVKLPMILFTLLFGLVLFFWTKKEFGPVIALFTTFLYAFSPTFITHGRFVTTDVGSAAGFFIATIAFIRFLRDQCFSNVLIAGLALGFAFLTKFSTFMLLPIFFILLVLWVIANRKVKGALFPETSQHSHMPFSSWYKAHAADHKQPEPEIDTPIFPLFFKFFWIVIIGYLAVWPMYWHHTRNYPPELQKRDTEYNLSTYGIGALRKAADIMKDKSILPQYEDRVRNFPRNAVVWASDKPVIRGLSEYFLGLLMVFQRVAGGNTTYFMGTVSKYGSQDYFPIVYALKEPIAMHAFTIIALIFALASFWRSLHKGHFLRHNFIYLSFIIVIAFYWWTSIRSILNIGVRHVLPTFPYVYILAAAGVVHLGRFLHKPSEAPSTSVKPAAPPIKPMTAVRNLPFAKEEIPDDLKAKQGIEHLNAAETVRGTGTPFWRYFFAVPFYALVVTLFCWQAYSVLKVHPYYLTYFNEIAGGPENGYLYVTDSNLDWGQDLKRLSNYVEANDIQEIHLDYFGWADPEYYLGEKRKWLNSCDDPRKGWVAVSASFYMGSREKAECDYRRWIPLEKRVTTIGHSIFVWHVE